MGDAISKSFTKSTITDQPCVTMPAIQTCCWSQSQSPNSRIAHHQGSDHLIHRCASCCYVPQCTWFSKLLLSKFVFKWIKRKMINEAKASAKSVWKVLFFIKDGQILPRFCLTTSPSHTVAVSSIRHIQSPSLRHYSEVTRVLEHLTGGSSSTYLQRRTWSCALLLSHSTMQNFGENSPICRKV